MNKIIYILIIFSFLISSCDIMNNLKKSQENPSYYLVGSGWSQMRYNGWAFNCIAKRYHNEKFYVKCVSTDGSQIIETYTDAFSFYSK
jgi:hypothetical protein